MVKLNFYLNDEGKTGPIITIDFDDGLMKLATKASIERILNTSLELLETATPSEEADINSYDLDVCKPIVATIFHAIREAYFKWCLDNVQP